MAMVAVVGSRFASGWPRNAIKLFLIGLYLASGYKQYAERLADLSLSPALTGSYLALFATLAGCLLVSAFIHQGLVRWSLAILFTASAVFCDSYIRITGDYLTYSMFVSQLHSAAFLDEALEQYRASILASVGWGMSLLLGLGLQPGRPGVARRRGNVHAVLVRWAPMVVPVAAIVLLTTLLFFRGGAGARGLPVMFITVSYLNLFAYERATNTIGPRQDVALPLASDTPGYDIILVIDESVGGNYLDINAEHGISTPLKSPPDGVAVHNFGYAAAIGSCSADVNVTLRFGGTREDYVRINASMPSIWQYARNAGMETVYIDAQRTGRRTQNLMTDWELNSIDQWIQFDGVPVLHRDMALGEKLAELINDGRPQLIITNKVGAHFPVHDKYPDEFMRYRPALARGMYEEVAETGARDGFTGTPEDWVRYRNSYKNTLLWNVGEFFSRLLASADFSKAVMIYTSDHGQDLHERGNPGLNTHCGGSPAMEEGLVPLVVIQGRSLETLDWASNLAANRNASSHYNIFPTLLQLMGYKLEPLRAIYGNPLSVATEDPFTFNTKFNGRMGAEPSWMFIDLDRIVTPPPG
jgi:glucan phosphoethanolaminetransferase (alkaline phosphatase superfamily)